jgi:hypothetical protein
MGCIPIVDRWIDEATNNAETKSKSKKSANWSLDGTNSIITDPSHDPDDSANLNSMKKAQRVWGNILEIDEENQQRVSREIDQECNFLQDQCQNNPCGNEVAQELTDDLKKVFSTEEIQRDLQKAFSSLQQSKKQPPSQRSVSTSSHKILTSKRVPSPPASLQEPSASLHTSNSSYNTSYLYDNTTLPTTASATQETESIQPVNPIVARMQRGLKSKSQTSGATPKQQSSSLASQDWNWPKWS